MADKIPELHTGRLKNIKIAVNDNSPVNSKAKVTKIEPDKPGEYKCTCCGTIYTTQPKNFPASKSPLFIGNNGYLSICRSCVVKYYNQLVEFYNGNEIKAIERCCQMFDWYFSEEAAASAYQKDKEVSSRVGSYLRKINMKQILIKGKTYDDTIIQKTSGKIQDSADIVFRPTDEGTIEQIHVDHETIEFFGFGFTPEEYRYLEDQYNDWTSRYECQTKAQEEIYKSLCVVQLNMQKAQQRNDMKSHADLMRSFQDLLGTAKLKPNQNNDNTLAEQNTFGTLIKKWENEEPIPEPDPEWADVDGIKKYIQVWFLGHLCKMFKIKNKYSELYEREISQHTVEPPTYEDDDDTFTNLLDGDNISEDATDIGGAIDDTH